MSARHRTLMVGLAAAAWLSAPAIARADAGLNFRKAYTGNAGGSTNFGAGYSLEYGLSASKANALAKVGGDARASTWARLFGKTFDAASMKASASGAVNTAAPTCWTASNAACRNRHAAAGAGPPVGPGAGADPGDSCWGQLSSGGMPYFWAAASALTNRWFACSNAF